MDSMKRQLNVAVSSFSFYQCKMIIEIAMHCVRFVGVFFPLLVEVEEVSKFHPIPTFNVGESWAGKETVKWVPVDY